MSDRAPGPDPSAWNVANALTVLRILLVPLFGWLLLRQHGENDVFRVLAFLAFAAAMFTDKIDGELARSRNLITDFGTIADPIADKALIGMALVGLSVLGEVPWWATVVILVREVGVTALRFVVIRHGVIPASRGGKTKTALQALAIGLYLLPLEGIEPVRVVVLVLAVVVTVVTGVDYVARAVTLRRTSPRAAAKRDAADRARLAGEQPS